MKRRSFWFCTIVLALLAPMAVRAQCITYSSDLSAYTDESTDGTNIYTSVEMDGTEEMTIAQSCAPYLPQYYHYPQVYNHLSISGGASSGGWGVGSQECPDCYLSYTNNQSIAASPGTTVNFDWQTQAICTGGGEFWGAEGALNLWPALTTYEIQTLYGSTADYGQQCTGDSTPTCGHSALLGVHHTSTWLGEIQLWVGVWGVGGVCIPSTGTLFELNGESLPPCT